jgi:hypothetical protein
MFDLLDEGDRVWFGRGVGMSCSEEVGYWRWFGVGGPDWGELERGRPSGQEKGGNGEEVSLTASELNLPD